MLEIVDVGERSLDAYRGVAPDALLDQLQREARDFRGVRVLHVNATPYGGGVSELLRSVVPLMNDLGLIAHWKIIRGDDAFFQVTKTIHNALQGGALGLSHEQEATYLKNAEQNARLLAFCLFMAKGPPVGSGVAISTPRSPTRGSGTSCAPTFLNTTRPSLRCLSLFRRTSPLHGWRSFHLPLTP